MSVSKYNRDVIKYGEEGNAPPSYLENVVEDLTPELGGTLDALGNDIVNVDSLFMSEKAADDADVAGKGQLWVRSDVPNELLFTNDAGTAYLIAGIKVETKVFMPWDFLPASTVSIGTGLTYAYTLNFADSGATYGQAHTTYSMPKRWDGGQMRWRFKWAPSNTNTGNCQFYLIGHFQAEGDAFAVGGTGNMLITDTPLGTTNDVQISPWSSWQTVDGTGNSDELFVFRIQRQAPQAGDTFTGTVQMFHIELQYTTNASTDE